MKGVWAVTAIGALAILGVGALVVSPKEADASVLTWTLEQSSCILSCESCVFHCTGNCPPPIPPAHVAPRVGDTNEYKDGWHELPDCYPGTCEEKHPSCEGTLAAATEVKDAIARGSVAQLAAVAGRYPETAQLHGKALQLLDCSGNVVAHIPFSKLGNAVAD